MDVVVGKVIALNRKSSLLWVDSRFGYFQISWENDEKFWAVGDNLSFDLDTAIPVDLVFVPKQEN